MEKKPVYKRWWFWVIVILVIGAVGSSMGDESDTIDKQVETKEADSKETEAQEGTEETTEEEAEEETEPEEEKEEFKTNEKIEFEGRVLEVTDIEYSNGSDFDKPKDGMEYVIVSVLIENNSDKELSYNPYDFKMQNSQGQIESQAFTIIDKETSLSSGKLAPGGNVSGTVVWEQPKDDDGLKLIFEPSFWSNKRVTVELD